MYIINGRVLGGGGGGGGGGEETPNILIFWLFLDNLSISEQIIDKALTIHTKLYNYDSMKKNNFIRFSPHTKTYPLALKCLLSYNYSFCAMNKHNLLRAERALTLFSDVRSDP